MSFPSSPLLKARTARRLSSFALTVGAVLAFVALSGTAPAQQTFTGGGSISVADPTTSGTNTSGSSTLTVSSASGSSIATVSVLISGIHTNGTSDYSMQGTDFILEGPGGNPKILLLGATGDGSDGGGLSGQNITIADSGTGFSNAPNGVAWSFTSSNAYVKPSSYWVSNGFNPPPDLSAGQWPQTDGANSGHSNATLNTVFNGTNPDGTWTLLITNPEGANLFGSTISVSSWALTFTYNSASATTTTLSPSAQPAIVGNSVNFSAKVSSSSGTPTGTVAFTENGSTIPGCSSNALSGTSVTSATATCSVSGLAQGITPIQASYTPSGNFAPSSSAILDELMEVTSTNTTGTTWCNQNSFSTPLNGNSIAYPSIIKVPNTGNYAGKTVDNVTVTLNVSGSGGEGVNGEFLLVAPGGAQNLDFMDTAFKSQAVSSPVNLTFFDSAGNLPDGTTAAASGSWEPWASTSSSNNYWISSTAPAIDTSIPQLPSTVNYASPRGGLTALNFETAMAAGSGAPAPGTWALYATSANGNSGMTIGSWCINLSLNTGFSSTTSVTSSAQKATTGSPVTFTATVTSSGSTAGGTVTFLDNGAAIAGGGSNVVSVNTSGVATYTTSTLTEGDHYITADFSGSTTANPSSGNLWQREDNATTVTSSNGVYKYCNTGAVTIAQGGKGAFTPNPSNIFVTNLPGTVSGVSLLLHNYFDNTNSVNEIESLVKGANGNALDFYSNTGLPNAPTTLGPGDLLFDDNSLNGLVPQGSYSTGTNYLPTSYNNVNSNADAFFSSSSPSSGSPYFVAPTSFGYAGGRTLPTAGNSTFSTEFGSGSADPNGNGTWSLFFNVLEATSPAGAKNGWCLNFTETPATVSVTAGHTGASGAGSDFQQGETGAAISVAVANDGTTGPTGDPTGTNPLTVTDTLNSGFSYTSYSGTGWTCTTPPATTVACTNDSSVAEGSSYPTLTLNVNVSGSAASPIANHVSVSGAGITSTSADDSIPVDKAPVLAVSVGHTGTFTQGSTAEWDVTVSNTLSGTTTSGLITVNDTLPSGYTLTGSSATGGTWGCGGSGTAVTCTSSSAISGGSSTTIKLTVNVPASSPTSVSDSASAYGGGDTTHTQASPATSTADNVTVVQVPASVVIASGNPQSATIQTTFTNSLVVTVKDAGGVAIANYTPVSFAAETGTNGQSGTFSNNSTMLSNLTTDTNGQLSEAITANSRVGQYSVTVTAGTAQTNFTLTNLAGPPANMTVVSGSPQSTYDTTPFSGLLEVNVTDAGGNPVSGATVSFVAPGVGPSASFAGGVNTAVTDTSGNASSVSLTANNVLGSYGVLANSGAASTSFSLTNTIGPYSQLAVTAPSPAYLGKQFLFTVEEEDAGGNAITPFIGNVQFSSTDGSAAITKVIPGGQTADTYYLATLNTLGPQTITVTNTANSISGTSGTITVDAVPNLVVTTTNDDAGTASNCTAQAAAGTGTDASCSLRDALLEAANLGAANITFDSNAFATAQIISPAVGLTLTIPAGAGISGPTTGSGASLTNLVTIQGNSLNTVPLFTVTSNTLGISIANLNLQVNTNTSGGAGAIENAGHLTVDSVTFGGNKSNNTSVPNTGGAIYNSGTLTVSNSTFGGNRADPGSSQTGDGGAIYTIGTGVLTVTNSTFSTNFAESRGGAIYDGPKATTVITNSTFDKNTAAGAVSSGGGAIYNDGTASLTVADSTFTGNNSTLQTGGAIYNQGGVISVVNSILSGNLEGTTADDVADTSGSVTTVPGNVIGVLNTVSTGSPAINLGSLTNNGGTTQTLLPLPGSPAICAGSTQFIPVGTSTDQRGYSNRNTSYPGFTSGPACVDAGAVQTNYKMSFTTDPPATITTHTTMSPSPVVTLTESSVTATTATGSVSVSDASSLLSGTNAATLSAGVATFGNLQMTGPASGDTLTATLALNSSVSLTAGSTSFDAIQIVPTQLVFTTPPAANIAVGGNAGSAITVAEEDAGGNVSTNSGDSITLTVTYPDATTQAYTATTSAGTAVLNLSAVALAQTGSYTYTATFGALTNGVATETVIASAYSDPSTNVGTSSTTQTATLLLNSNFTLGSIGVLTQGAANLDFQAASGGTCSVSTAYTAGQACTVNYTFNPTRAGTRYGAVVLYDNGSTPKPVATVYLQGTGTGPQVVFSPPTRSTMATLTVNAPKGVAVDGNGTVFVADSSTTRVRVFTPSGGSYVLSSISGIDNPSAVAVDGAGNVYITEPGYGSAGQNRIDKASLSGSSYTHTPILSDLTSPMGVAVDGSGNLYISDTGTGRVLKATLSGGTYTESTIATLAVNSPKGIAVDGNGTVFVADSSTTRVRVYTPSGGTYVASVISGIDNPSSVAVDGTGNVYITEPGYASPGQNRLDKARLSGSSYTYTSILTDLTSPMGVAVDASGNLYVSDTGTGHVLKEDYTTPPSLSFATTAAGSTSSDSPQTLTVANDGNAGLNITGISYATDFPEAAGVATDCTSSTALAAGNSCTLTIDFSPLAASAIGATTALSEHVRLTSNNLNGTGVVQSATVNGTETIGPPFGGAGPVTDATSGGTTTIAQTDNFFVSGAAVDPHDGSPVLKVQIVIDGAPVGTATLGLPSPGLAATYSNPAFANGGWTFTGSASGLSLGTHTLSVIASDSLGLSATIRTESFTIAATSSGPPFGGAGPVTDATTGATTTIAQTDNFFVAGAAVDPHDGSPVLKVQIAIDGAPVGTATLGLPSPGLAATYSNPAFANGGWTFTGSASGLSLGTHTLTAVASDSLGLSTTIVSESFTIATTSSGPPFGGGGPVTDATTGGTTTIAQTDNFFVAGATVDPHDGSPVSQVQISIDGAPVGTATLGLPSPGLAARYNNSAFANGGWTFTGSASGLSLGTHTLTAVASDSLGLSTTIVSESFTIATTSSGPPFGGAGPVTDATSGGTTTIAQTDNFFVAGATVDPHDGSPVLKVQIAIDGAPVGTATLGSPSPGLAARYSNPAFANGGWTFTGSASGLSLGTHTLTAVASDSLGLSATIVSENFTVAATSSGPPFGGGGPVTDATTGGTTTIAQTDNFFVAGATVDPHDGSPVLKVQIAIDGTPVGTATLGLPSPGLAARYSNPAFANGGWTFTGSASGLSLGTHTLTAVASDSLGLSTTIVSESFTIAATSSGPPFGGGGPVTDATTGGTTTIAQTDNFFVAGAAVDPHDGSPVLKVQIAIDGAPVGTATLGSPSPGLAARYSNPAFANGGWTFTGSASGLSLGTHTLTAVASDSLGLSTTIVSESFTIAATSSGPPFGGAGPVTDATTGSSGTVAQAHNFRITGATVDPHDGSPVSQVQIVIDGAPVGTATLGLPSPGLAATYSNPAFANGGWTFTGSASGRSPGTHTLSVIASDSLGLSATIVTETFTVTP